MVVLLSLVILRLHKQTDNTIDTVAGNLILDSAGGIVDVNDNV